jgi:hypothetical protein
MIKNFRDFKEIIFKQQEEDFIFIYFYAINLIVFNIKVEFSSIIFNIILSLLIIICYSFIFVFVANFINNQFVEIRKMTNLNEPWNDRGHITKYKKSEIIKLKELKIIN